MFSCDKVITIPQTRGTCWFNTILMAIFYSQHSRKLFYHHFENKKDKFSRIMNDIIKHNYIKKEQTIEYFKFMKPENMLKYVDDKNKTLYEHFKDFKDYGYWPDLFLPFFLKSLNKKILDVIITDDNCYANFYSIFDRFIVKKQFNNTNYITLLSELYTNIDKWNIKDIEDPEYIIVHKGNAYSTVLSIINKNLPEVITKLNLKNHNIHIKGIFELDNEIYHNGNKYILDSAIVGNYNKPKGIPIDHVIAGITCKNKRFIYNGWIRTTQDPSMPKNFGNKSLPCELMEFNWDVKKDTKFSLNPQFCKIDTKLSPNSLYFSFNKIDKGLLIYVKDTSSIKSIDTNLSVSSSLTLPSLKSNSSKISELNFKNKNDKIKYKLELKQRKLKQDEYKIKTKKPKEPKKEPEKPEKPKKEPKEKPEKPKKEPKEKPEKPKKEPEKPEKPKKEPKKEPEKPEKPKKEPKEKPKKEPKEKPKKEPKEKPKKEPKEKPDKPKEPKREPKEPKREPKEPKIEPKREIKKSKECNKFTYDTSYIDCLLAAFFNNNNSMIEEIFFNIKLTNKYAIAIRDEFKSYYETKTYNKIKLLKAIQMYYNEFNIQKPEYPKIFWAKGIYYFTDLIILLQQIFKFDKSLIQILLSYNEKFKIIDKKQITEIKTIQITKLKPNPPIEMKSLLLYAIVARLDNKYICFYNCKNKWYDNNNKIIENIDKHLKTEKYKIVSYLYY